MLSYGQEKSNDHRRRIDNPTGILILLFEKRGKFNLANHRRINTYIKRNIKINDKKAK